MDWEHEERRTTRRVGCDLNHSVSATVEVDGQQSYPVALYLLDMSEGGMRINMDRQLPTEKPFTLCVNLVGLGGSGEFRTTCEVAWQKGLLGEAWVAGLRFTTMTEADGDRLRSTISQFDGPNRRLRFRLRSVVPVSVRFEDDWFYMTATELSPEGLRIRTTPVPWLSPGCELSLWLHLGSEWPLEPLDAEVLWREEVWRDRIEVGFRFLDLTEDDALLIQSYIERSLQDEATSSSPED